VGQVHVGHAAALGRARRQVDAARQGRGGLLLTGPAGIGKTNLASRLAEGAHSEGLATAWAMGGPGGRSGRGSNCFAR